MDLAARRLRTRLLEDYDHQTDPSKIEHRPWFGRCVYESDNDVCDDQIVTINWDGDPLPHDKQLSMSERLKGRGAKTTTFHMIAKTEKQCERRGRGYRSKGEIEYDGKMIRVYEFATSEAQVHYPHQAGGATAEEAKASQGNSFVPRRLRSGIGPGVTKLRESTSVARSKISSVAMQWSLQQKKHGAIGKSSTGPLVAGESCAGNARSRVFGGGHSLRRSAIYGGFGVARSALSSTLDRLCLHIHANSHQDRKEHSRTATEAWNDQRSGWYAWRRELS